MAATWPELQAIGGAVQSVLGCGWGRVVAEPDDNEPCPAQAVRIIVCHHEDGTAVDVRVCQRHGERLVELSTPTVCPGAGKEPLGRARTQRTDRKVVNAGICPQCRWTISLDDAGNIQAHDWRE